MRWLMWITIGLASGCAAGAYLFRGTGLLVLAAVCLPGMISAVIFGKDRKALTAFGAVMLGVVLGCGLFLGYDGLYVEPVRALDGGTTEITVRASDHSWETEYGSSVDGTVEISGKRYKIRLYLEEPICVTPGDILTLIAKLRLTDEGGLSEPTFHRTNGILILGYQQEPLQIIHGEPGWREYPGVLRQKLKTNIDRAFPEDTRGFARALLLGDKTELSYETSLSFRITGVSHIVAVSGLHVSILFALIYVIAGKHRYVTGLIGIPLMILFAAVAGFTPSVTRAALMQMIMMLSLMVRREYDPPTALAFAVLVILGVNPLTIASAGFQMSVSSVAGIYLFHGKIRKFLSASFGGRVKGKSLPAKLLRGVITAVAVSVSATVMVTPLVAYYYGTVSLVSLPANLLVVPVVSVIFYGVMLAGSAGMVLPALGAMVGWVASWLIRYVFALTGFLAEVPLAAVYTESVYVVFWLVFVYLLMVCGAVRRPERIWPYLCCGIAGLGVALMLSWAEPRLDDYRVTVLDVGQGQCVMLQSGGRTVLVDCGGDEDTAAGDKAAEYLLSMGITRIDGLILSHYDRDHAGGIPYLAERIEIDRLYLPGAEDGDRILPQILASCGESDICWVDSDREIALGSGLISIFVPGETKSGNESSCSVLFQGQKYDTLILNDMNEAAERNLLATRELPDLEILIVGHHGSDTSTSAELVYRTAPDVAVISVGADNRYGHPAPEVLNRLLLYGCEIYRTDFMGDIVFRG